MSDLIFALLAICVLLGGLFAVVEITYYITLYIGRRQNRRRPPSGW